MLGKWKVSQNQPPENQLGVFKGLSDSGQSVAAELVASTSKI
jgi:transcriptional regulator